jgi:hypothetical protein
MADQEKRNPALRNMGQLFGAIALSCIATAIVFGTLHHHPKSLTIRAGAVAIGLLGFIPWQLATAKSIRLQDEFTLRIHLIALGIAFAVTNTLVFAANLLVFAGFIDYVPLMYIWFGMFIIWWLAIMMTARYYR